MPSSSATYGFANFDVRTVNMHYKASMYELSPCSCSKWTGAWTWSRPAWDRSSSRRSCLNSSQQQSMDQVSTVVRHSHLDHVLQRLQKQPLPQRCVLAS